GPRLRACRSRLERRTRTVVRTIFRVGRLRVICLSARAQQIRIALGQTKRRAWLAKCEVSAHQMAQSFTLRLAEGWPRLARRPGDECAGQACARRVLLLVLFIEQRTEGAHVNVT